MKAEPLFISYDFLKVESLKNMPEMIESLTLDDLKKFFVEKAKELGRQVTK